MWIVELLKTIFGFGKATAEAVTARTKPAEIQAGEFEIRKPTMTEAEVKKIADKRNRLADEMFGDLVHHPEINIADKVNFEATELDEDERKLLIKILTDRLEADHRYQKAKHKKGKFDYPTK